MRRWLPVALTAILLAGGSLTASGLHVWPSFRGIQASGVSDQQMLPGAWNVETGENIRWKVTIPGLAHSSPIVHVDRVFVTTAISAREDATFKPGLYGEGTASEDRSIHRWVVMALDTKTGRTLWQQTAFEGAPVEKRHIKSTYASSTPATDGKVVVAFFGSQGVYGYSMDGTPLWKKDLGHLDVGAYDIPSYEWGTASSPILHNGRAILQVDTSKEDYLLALDAMTGRELWRTAREELPSWGTPTIVQANGRTEIVTNSSNFIRGYDFETGRELWRLGGSSQITAPTPIFAEGTLIVASGRRPTAPLIAVKPGGSGDITGTDAVRWSKLQRGAYMPTPIAYAGQLYVLNNAGIFDSYELQSGAEIYRERLLHQGSGFSASPVISDGRLFASSEDGDIFVVKTGRTFEVVGKNSMGEPLMATPAIAGRTMYVRGQRTLFAIGAQ